MRRCGTGPPEPLDRPREHSQARLARREALWSPAMLQDDVARAFWRPFGSVPRAAPLAYAIAVLWATVHIATGLYDGGRRHITDEILTAVYGFGVWVAIGTGLALLAQIADHGRRPGGLYDRRVVEEPAQPLEL